MGKFHVGRKDQELAPLPEKESVELIKRFLEQPVHEVRYIDRPVEVIREITVEKPVIEIREVIKEVIVEKPVERIIVKHETVEVPVVYEKEIIKEVPVYIEKEVIREVMPKVIDITGPVELKKKDLVIRRIKAGLVLSIILNIILMVVK